MIEEIEEIGEDLFFVAASPVMRKLRLNVEALARVNVPVWIVGEPGSGKEAVARLLHKLSARSESRFVKINCAVLPCELLEAELFGQERSGTPGVVRTRPGKFELCDKGTILLDEIPELPASLQANVLQILHDRRFFRPGSDLAVGVDVRVLASSSIGLEQVVAEKRLGRDVFHQLSAFVLRVPTLRERKDEIKVLLGYFMSRLARRYGMSPRPISNSLLAACEHHLWPGNLRQLENFVKRYLVMGDEEMALTELDSNLAVEDRQLLENFEERHGGNGKTAHDDDNGTLKMLVRSVAEQTEKTAIITTLEKTRWNRKEAAQLLGISYRGLLYKIQQYRLSPTPVLSAVAKTNGGAVTARSVDVPSTTQQSKDGVHGSR